ncbi:5'-3' exonuclease PLD3-like [Anopheles albimanus]|uniref:PLD phosphodiesterase domain-containing protein n=1 Tax=Anopheles albimanus TaxID=7167 RepID=A0A182FK36_ANOAL|nr:5'-3' exonuclease PLD3-like [Anopheles albimanus]
MKLQIPLGRSQSPAEAHSEKSANEVHVEVSYDSPTSAPTGDDFELWDQSKALRSEYRDNRWAQNGWSSCIPISVILLLIVLVVLLPLMDGHGERTGGGGGVLAIVGEDTTGGRMKGRQCPDRCRIELVESIPEGLVYPPDSPAFRSTYDAWSELLSLATATVDIGSFYWTLKGADVFNHSSAREGEDIFRQLLKAGTTRQLQVRIAQSTPTSASPNLDTEILARQGAATVRSVDFQRLLGGGVLHTKLWIVDDAHFYVGSANMDWRSLTQVKELGVLGTNCSCLVKDVAKIFRVYWDMGVPDAKLPPKWPAEYAADFNDTTPALVQFNDAYTLRTFFSSSPPPMSPAARTDDCDAILKTILAANRFVHVSVMDYFPLTLYTRTTQYWPIIDDALRKAAIERKISIRLLISLWDHSRPSEDYFLHSLEALSNSLTGVDIQIRRFIVPATDDQRKIPYGRVNHNKYMVTDNTAYIGTSNWSGDYFIDTAGIGLVMSSFDTNGTIISELQALFARDWNSKYAVPLS